ncbi:hypothetical protein DFH27DRAFT_574538 [Peziza echinospora]|nr:hypothetical protein DFH27DRAFT_574538 [Peziza echinospora]
MKTFCTTCLLDTKPLAYPGGRHFAYTAALSRNCSSQTSSPLRRLEYHCVLHSAGGVNRVTSFGGVAVVVVMVGLAEGGLVSLLCRVAECQSVEPFDCVCARWQSVMEKGWRRGVVHIAESSHRHEEPPMEHRLPVKPPFIAAETSKTAMEISAPTRWTLDLHLRPAYLLGLQSGCRKFQMLRNCRSTSRRALPAPTKHQEQNGGNIDGILCFLSKN